MDKKIKAYLAVMLVMALPGILGAITNYGAPQTNVVQVGNVAVDVNTGNASNGTQRVVLATNQPAIPVTLGVSASTQAVNVGQWGGTATTLGQKQKVASVPVVLASDQDPLPFSLAGTVTVTPGTGTWNTSGSTVSVQNVGGTSLDSNLKTVNGTSISLGATTGSASLPVVLPTDMLALVTVSTNVGTPVQHSVGATVTSATLVPANANRVGIECDSDCSNNKDVYIGFGVTATNAMKIISPCSSWQPPAGLRFTSSITVISALGTQTVRCVEY